MAQRGEKLKAYKTAFITEALDLTASEAEKFWPIYNVHEDKMMALRKSERKEIFETVRHNLESLSEEEANKLIDRMVDLKSKEFIYEKELIQNLKGILPAKKIIRLKKAEEEFKHMLLDKFRNRKGRHP
ncbi:MAG: sensor of ECF-type sigma factor [Alteromonas sp.]|nr:sensor of ECF-type sigma factor [Alteromonas sp.]